MADLKGTNVYSPIVPGTDSDTYPTHYAKYGKGGYVSVDTIEERNAIPIERKEGGMLCLVKQDPDKIYLYTWDGSVWAKPPFSSISQSGDGKVTIVGSPEDLAKRTELQEGGQIVYIDSTDELLFWSVSNRSWTSFDHVRIQDTPPTDKETLWVDTSGLSLPDIKNPDLQPVIEAIQAINGYLDTIVRQRDLIINAGDFSNNFSNYMLGKATPINPKPESEEKINIIVSKFTDEVKPPSELYEPNTKAIVPHYGTQAELEKNFDHLIENELLITTDTNRLYTKRNGKPINLTGNGGGGGGSIDYDALDKLDTIGLVAPNGQVWRVKVNNNGSLVVYRKELDTDQSEPTGGQTDPNTGWVYVTTLFLQKLYINSLYCGGISSNEYSYNLCSHNFVELSNLTTSDISLKGLSLQYGTEGTEWEVLPLWGTIKTGSTFLIRGAQCSVMDVNTTRIKVDTFDMEWRDSKGELIRFDNTKAKFFLTWGTSASPVSNPYNNSHDPIRVSKGYIDLVGIQIPNAGDADKVDASENTPYGYMNPNYLFTKYYTMDPVSQATKALSARNNANDMYFVNLAADIIPRVDSYTPKASFQNKNIFFNKTLLDPKTPNKVTMTLGINGTAPNATRCFNWVSVGYYDEVIVIHGTSSDGNSAYAREIESFKNETGVRKYYNRIRAITTDGTPFTTHKVVVKNLQAGIYSYYITRKGDPSYKSPEFIFRIENTDDIKDQWGFIQTSDQQGFNWDEYQVWKLSAAYITSRYILLGNNVKFMINTGDMTQNGNRINEWLDYDNGKEGFTSIPEMVTVGNNDLTPANVYVLGNGGDNSKINATNIRFFYCFEIDEENPPVFTVDGVEVFVDSLYSFNFADTHFVCVNSEISANTELDVYKLPRSKVIYDLIREWCERDISRYSYYKKRIAYCHEMPFTILTQNLINSYYWNGLEDDKIERSGSRLNFNTTDSNKYWFSKFLQTNNYQLCIGGHKHTYTGSYPILENEGKSMKPIIQVTPKMLLDIWGDTALYTEETGSLSGQSFPLSWKNNDNYEVMKHLCTFQLSNKITAPTYVMSQATGYKHTSNKELPAPEIPWLRYYFPATVTINSQTNIVAKVNAGQRYPFFICYNFFSDEIDIEVIKLGGIFNNSGKFNVNLQGVNAFPAPLGGNGETNNGNDHIKIDLS